MVRSQAYIPHLIQSHFQGIGHHFQEPPRAGGALVVHGKIVHPPLVIQGNGLAVLAPHIDDAPDIRIQKMGPCPVAEDLGHGFVGKVDAGPAVSRGHDGPDIGPGQAGLLQQVLEHAGPGFQMMVSGGHHPGAHQGVLLDQGRLGRVGTDIDTGKNHDRPALCLTISMNASILVSIWDSEKLLGSTMSASIMSTGIPVLSRTIRMMSICPKE